MASSFILPLADLAAQSADRVGPKAANLAALAHAGLPTPGGFCITADAYHRQIAHLGLLDAIAAYPVADTPTQRRLAVEIRLKLYQSDLAPDVLAEVLSAWWAEPKPAAVRSSSLVEDRVDSSFAGQFESFLGISDDSEFLTALRACWAALWTTNARRSMAQHDLDPAGTAMAVLVQPLVAARVSGGGLSETAEGHMLLVRHLGTGLGDRAGRSGAGSHRADAPRFRPLERRRPQGSPRGLRSWRRRRPDDAASGARRSRARAVPRIRPSYRARDA